MEVALSEVLNKPRSKKPTWISKDPFLRKKQTKKQQQAQRDLINNDDLRESKDNEWFGQEREILWQWGRKREREVERGMCIS